MPAGPAGAGSEVPADVQAELVLVRNRGAATRSFPAATVKSPAGGPPKFRVLVPLSDLAGATDVVDRACQVAGDDGMAWDVYIKLAGRPGSGWRGRKACRRAGTCSAAVRPWSAGAATVTLCYQNVLRGR